MLSHLAGCAGEAGTVSQGWLEGVPVPLGLMGQWAPAPDVTVSVLKASICLQNGSIVGGERNDGTQAVAAFLWLSLHVCKQAARCAALLGELCFARGLRMRKLIGRE